MLSLNYASYYPRLYSITRSQSLHQERRCKLWPMRLALLWSFCNVDRASLPIFGSKACQNRQEEGRSKERANQDKQQIMLKNYDELEVSRVSQIVIQTLGRQERLPALGLLLKRAGMMVGTLLAQIAMRLRREGVASSGAATLAQIAHHQRDSRRGWCKALRLSCRSRSECLRRHIRIWKA